MDLYRLTRIEVVKVKKEVVITRRRIREWLAIRGLTNGDLIEAVGISKHESRVWRNNANDMPLEVAVKVARFLQISVDEIQTLG